ncbi:MAG TPA: hypothetical protein VGS20_08970 [Candidatus Acidoferrales bacterium]|nr:hypothetical protein [Candidatus Acidoferrales bacterium]
MTLEEALVAVWRQALVEESASVELAGQRFSVLRTPRKGLRQVDFTFRGESLRGLEQNPQTASRWAKLARGGARVMQFLSSGRYVAVVVDGKVTTYGGRKPHRGSKA